MKTYILLYFWTSDDIVIESFVTANEIREIIKKESLTKWDYAIIDGEMIKSFDNGSFDIKNL